MSSPACSVELQVPAAACHQVPLADLVHPRAPITASPEAVVSRATACHPRTVLVQTAEVADGASLMPGQARQGPAPSSPTAACATAAAQTHRSSANCLMKVMVPLNLTSRRILSGGWCCNTTFHSAHMFCFGKPARGLMLALGHPVGTNSMMPPASKAQPCTRPLPACCTPQGHGFFVLPVLLCELWLKAEARTALGTSTQCFTRLGAAKDKVKPFL